MKRFIIVFFILSWILTMYHPLQETDYVKMITITGVYYCIVFITVSVWQLKDYCKQLQVETGDGAIVTRCDLEYDLSTTATAIGCIVTEIVYCCVRGFNTSSILHGLLWTASCFPIIRFVIISVFHRRCKTLVGNTKSLSGIEVDEKVQCAFKLYQKILLAVTVLLNACTILGYFRKDFIDILLPVSAFVLTITFVFLSVSENRTQEVLYDLEGTLKKFHLSVLDQLHGIYSLTFATMIFATISSFFIDSEAFIPEIKVLFMVIMVTLVNMCFSATTIDYVKVNYLRRKQKIEKNKVQAQQES